MWYFTWILGVLMACFAGVVKAINVAEEDFVNEEDVLVVVEQTLPF